MSAALALKERVAAPLRGVRLVRSALRLLAEQPAVTAVSMASGIQLIVSVVLLGPLVYAWVETWLRPEAVGVISMLLTLIPAGIVSSIIDAYLDVVMLIMLREAHHGRSATIREGVRAANRQIRTIGVWSMVASSGFVGRSLLQIVPGTRLLRWAGGLAFELATFFVTPVIAFEERDAGATFRRSAGLIRRNAGRAIAPTAGMLVACLPAFLPALVLIWAAHLLPVQAWTPGEPYPPADEALLVLGTIALVPGAVLLGTSTLLLRFALYERATGGTAPAGYSERDLEAALPA